MIATDALTQPQTGPVVEVLPATGLADVAGDRQAVRTLTRSTRCAEGLSLADLRQGQHLVPTLASLGRDAVLGHDALAAGGFPAGAGAVTGASSLRCSMGRSRPEPAPCRRSS